LISMFFLGLFAAMLFQFNRAVLSSVRLQETCGEAQETTRIVIDMMTRELRLSGYSGRGARLAGLRVATSERLELQADLNGDGDTDDANEVVGYSYDAERAALLRATGNAPPQPMLDHVPAGGFVLGYRDGNNVSLSGDLDAAARARVHQVEIGLHVVYPNPNPGQTTPVIVRQHGVVELRNATP
jgi:hypothetical protein